MLRLENAHRLLDRIEEERRDHQSDPNPSALAARRALRHFADALGPDQRLLDRLQHHAAGVGQLDLVSRAPKELDAEVALHVPDSLRERRLAHVQLFGRAPEVQLLGDCHETTHLA